MAESLSHDECDDDDDDDDDICEEEEAAEIHNSIETIIEGLLGKSLADAPIDHIYSSAEYKKLFSAFYPPLIEAIRNLFHSLRTALHGFSYHNYITPTAAHATLKYLISAVIAESQKLPHFQTYPDSDESFSNDSTTLMDMNMFSYECLVATAIINKVVEESQLQYFRYENVKKKYENEKEFYSYSKELVNACGMQNMTEEPFSIGQLFLEHQIGEEEETTQENTDSDDEFVYHTNEENEFDQDVANSLKNSDSFICHSSIMCSWRENWLFREKKRLPLNNSMKNQLLNFYVESPLMLIPCPSEDTLLEVGYLSSDSYSTGSVELYSDCDGNTFDNTEDHKDSSFLYQDNNQVRSTHRLEKHEPVMLHSDGSIAEREHKKCQNAVPLKNNSYSPESRTQRCANPHDRFLSVHTLPYSEYRQELPMFAEANGQPLQTSLYCGLKCVDSNRYKRDYYVHNTKKVCEYNDCKSLESMNCETYVPSSDEALNSLEEKIYVSSGKIFTCENQVRRLERELKDLYLSSVSPHHITHQDLSEKELNDIHSPTVQDNCENVALPSVKTLATRFSLQQIEKSEKIAKNTAEELEKGSVKIKKSRPCVKVHSLTARSLTREFRDRAKQNIPKPMNRFVSTPQQISDIAASGKDSICSLLTVSQADNNYGYTSDESSGSSNSLPQSQTSSKISNSILQKMSFQKIKFEKNLFSDTSVNKNHPD